jgi:probable F420-dependent oxidoreductase
VEQLKFGVVLAQQHDTIGYAMLAEQLGFDSLWVGEHINWHIPMPTVIPVLGALAACTSRVTIGSGILLLPLRKPALIAKELAVLDVLSRGRLVVGVGIGGEFPGDYAACDVPLSERGARANEMLEILPQLWQHQQVTYDGKFFKLDNVTILPKPVQPKGPPILVGGRSEAALRRVAKYADGYLGFLVSPAQYAKALDQANAYAQQSGRQLDHFQKCLALFVALGDTKDEARRAAIEYLGTFYQQDFSKFVDRFCLLGTPDDCVARLGEYVEAGVRHFALGPCAQFHDAAMEREWLTTFAEQVLPAAKKHLQAGQS